MKFLSTVPDYFSDLPERFLQNLNGISVIHGVSGLNGGNGSIILVEDSLEPKEVVNTVSQRALKHVVQKNSDYFEEDLWTTGQLVMEPGKYFSEGARSLIENSKRSHKIEFALRADKERLKQESLNFVGHCASQNLSQAAETVIEELYMNAVIDAPKEAGKKGMHVDTAKKSSLELECHDTRLVISCTDPYAALDIDRFLGRMTEVYTQGAGEVINLKNQGGAGLGCVIMFEHCMSLVLGVQKNGSTRVSCVLPVGVNNRQRANLKKSLHRIETG